MKPLTDGDKLSLEQIIDMRGLAATLDAIGHICFDKAEHIRSTWRDNALAGLWDTAGKAIGTVERRQSVRMVS
jgi:hypothetical protein